MENDQEIQFRGPGDIEQDIKQIAPEELAVGMLEILKQNVTADKNGMYRSLVSRCGINSVGKTINEALNSALCLLEDTIVIYGNQLSLR